MPPPAKKKRKTAAGSAAVTGTRRTTRIQRPGLSLEIIAKVATFAQYDDGDVMNICLAVGPTDAAVVRYTCLRKNYRYLQHALERNIRSGTAIHNTKTGSDIRAWISINTDWKDDPVVGRATRESSEGVTSTVVVRENGVLRAKCLARAIFHNPAVAIQFGLDDVLRHLVETVGIDINACKWNNYARDTRFHLLVQAILHEESACLEYLLSTEKIDMNTPVVHEHTHTLKMFVLDNDDIQKDFFQAIVRYPTFGVNVPMNVVGSAFSPLIYMCVFRATKEAPMSPKHMELIQVLLDEGADPTLQIGDNLSPLDFAFFAASRMNVEATREDKAVWKEIVRMMERKVRSSE